MAGNAPNEIDEVIKQLKSNHGFTSYILMNNEGIVIKYENLEYKEAVMYAYHILSLYQRTKKHMQHFISDPNDSEIESIRLRTKLHEVIISQHLHFTFVALQKAEKIISITNTTAITTSEEIKENQEDKNTNIPS